eukprot:1161185-Pelagomonas_calceolata.AAC.2
MPRATTYRVPEQLYERVVEVDESVVLPLGSEPSARNGKDAARNAKMYRQSGPEKKGVTGEVVCVRKAPDLEALTQQLQVGCMRLTNTAEHGCVLVGMGVRVRGAVRASGIRSLAVVLKHAAVFPDHEQAVGMLARELGFEQARVARPIGYLTAGMSSKIPEPCEQAGQGAGL